jgi:zinc protease
VAQLGASLQASSTKDSTTVTVGALARNFGAALEIAADVSLRPTFPEAEVARLAGRRQASLAANRQNPATVATTAATFALYGHQHPYAYNELGTDAAISSTTREDLVTFWKRTFVPGNAALVVAGPLTEAELRPIVERSFGRWSGGPPAAPTLGAPRRADVSVIIVNMAGAPQTQVLVTTIGAARRAPDYAETEVMNAGLGGLFSSRINLNLREAHGYSYGARSQFLFRKAEGPFWVSAAVRTEATAPAVAEILKEIRRMGDAPMSPEELKLAKDSIVRSLPSDFETSASTVTTLGGLFVYDLGLDYYTKLPAAIGGVTAASAQASAKKYLDPKRLLVVAVGDRARIEAGLRGLNLGKLEVRPPQ